MTGEAVTFELAQYRDVRAYIAEHYSHPENIEMSRSLDLNRAKRACSRG